MKLLRVKILSLLVVLLLLLPGVLLAEPATWTVSFENGNDAKIFQEAATYLATCQCVVVDSVFIRGHRIGELQLTLQEVR